MYVIERALLVCIRYVGWYWNLDGWWSKTSYGFVMNHSVHIIHQAPRGKASLKW